MECSVIAWKISKETWTSWKVDVVSIVSFTSRWFNTVSHFIDCQLFLDVNEKIRLFERSNKEGEIEEVDKALRQNSRDIRGREERLTEMKPEIDNLKKQVEDG